MGKVIDLVSNNVPSRQDKKAYTKLIRAVKKIDKKLGMYLINTAIELPHFQYDGDLRYVFTWTWSAHGKKEWEALFLELVASNYYHSKQFNKVDVLYVP